MAKNRYKILSAAAIASVYGASALSPVAAESPVVKKIDTVFLEYEGLPYEISLENYNFALAAGITFSGGIIYISSNKKVYDVKDYNLAYAVAKSISGAIELLEQNGGFHKDIIAGEIEIDEDGNVSYIDSNTTKENETKRYFIN
ncbi:hypothetical protein [Solibacillus sp. FSL K6-1523]|uniref:hypothetical protein n=1 Tax=Solibacillus sp. FSL K6-1523 TaxID=2921471 RepID=UPI0030FBAFB8